MVKHYFAILHFTIFAFEFGQIFLKKQIVRNSSIYADKKPQKNK